MAGRERCESSSRCRAASTRRWPRRCSPSRATTSSVCRCSSTIRREGRPYVRQLLLARRPARRAARRRRHRHPALHPELRAAVRRAGRLELRRASTPPGRTPLPCAHCNSDLKFATLAERARGFGADAVATGHYARVERDDRDRTLPAEARRRPGEGPVVLPVLAHAGAARARASSRSAIARRTPCASTRAAAGCRWRTSRTARRSASSRTTTTRRSSAGARRTRAAAGRDRRRAGTRARPPRAASTASPSASARALACRARPTGAPLYVLALDARRSAGRRRPEGVARADDADGVGRELDDATSPAGPSASPRRSAIGISAAPATVTLDRRRHRPSVVFDTPQIAITPGQAVVFYDGDVVVGRRLDRLTDTYD